MTGKQNPIKNLAINVKNEKKSARGGAKDKYHSKTAKNALRSLQRSVKYMSLEPQIITKQRLNNLENLQLQRATTEADCLHPLTSCLLEDVRDEIFSPQSLHYPPPPQ